MPDAKPTEVLFYHLERTPLERVLPELLEKTLARFVSPAALERTIERLVALDTVLWTYRDNSFLPHGKAGDDESSEQPIILTTGTDTPNGATIRFFADGSTADDLSAYQRAIYLFDGRDEEAVAQARGQLSSAKQAGHDVTYWQQTAQGKWEQKE